MNLGMAGNLNSSPDMVGNRSLNLGMRENKNTGPVMAEGVSPKMLENQLMVPDLRGSRVLRDQRKMKGTGSPVMATRGVVKMMMMSMVVASARRKMMTVMMMRRRSIASSTTTTGTMMMNDKNASCLVNGIHAIVCY